VWNEYVQCVRAPSCATDHFWQMGDLNIRFWGENGKNPWPKHAKTRVSERYAWSGALGVHTQEANAAPLAPGAPNRGWRCSSTVFIHFTTGTYLAWSKLRFSNGLKLEIVLFQFFGFYRKMECCEQKELRGWSTVLIGLDKACEVRKMSWSCQTWFLGAIVRYTKLGIFYTNLG